MGVRFPSLALICLFILSGCATKTGYIAKPEIGNANIPGIYHKVIRGETLWRISKRYGIELDELVNINHIPNAGSIETGQLIFIPQNQQQQTQTTYLSGAQDDFIWPVKGKIISYFGETYENMLNKGIHIQPAKNRDVVAAHNGRVVFYTQNLTGFGRTVILEHEDGILSVYARAAEVFVRPGETVKKGTLIAKTGSYLHFQIRKNSVPKNPLFYLPNPSRG